jgi:alpha-glucosidase
MRLTASRILAGWIVVAHLGFLRPAEGLVVTNGPATSVVVTSSPNGNLSFLFKLSPTGDAEVTTYAPDVVRVRFHFAGLYEREEVAIAKSFTNWSGFAASYTNRSTNLVINTGQLNIEVVLSNRFAVHIRDNSNRDILLDRRIEYDLDYQMITDTSAYAQVAWPNGTTSVSNRPSGFKLRSIKEMPAGQAYFGLGDFAGPLNRRGQVIQCWNQDTYGFTETHNPKYMALPFWYGAQPATMSRPAYAYGVFFNNPARPIMDFSSTNGSYSFEAGDDQLDYFVFGGGATQTMSAVLQRFAELTGRPAFLPKWAYGYHQSRHSYFTQQDTLDTIAEFRSRDIPCDAIYLDIGVQRYTNSLTYTNAQPGQLSFNPSSYSNVSALVTQATNQGMRLVPIIEPLLTVNDPLYGVALTNLYFIKTNNLATYVGENFLGPVSWLDFSIGNTRDWWTAQLTNYLATYRLEAIWNDLTEPNENAMPLNNLWFLDGRYGGGLVTNDSRKWHAVNKNTYAVMASQVSDRALRAQYPSLRPFVLTRGAWPGVQAYAAGWSGDNKSDFDHLRFNTRLAASVMISGQANFGNDVGGFIGLAGAELLTRWLQAGVLSPLYRNHNYLDLAPPNPQEPWVHGEPYTLWNRRTIQWRYQLMPFLYSLAQQASTSGVPMNTPVAFYFTGDSNTWSQNEYDFMVGRDVLAAPVVSSGAVTRTVYLPAGSDWYHAGSDTRYSGGQAVVVKASLGNLPHFLRAGAILPQGPVMEYADETPAAYLDVHVWPGASNSFSLFEDDGRTTNHLAGVFARTPMTAQGSATGLTVALGPRSGSYIPAARDWYVVAHAMSNVTSVTMNGIELTRFGTRTDLAAAAGSGWCYDTVSRQAVLRYPDTGVAVTGVFSGASAFATPVAHASAYSNLAVAGTFTFWNEAARNMTLVAPHTWVWVTALGSLTNTEFKLVANDDWTFANWGETNQSDAEIPLSQTAESFGSNIVITNLAAGLYTFQFNETSLVYSITAASAQDSDGDGMRDDWEFTYGLHPALAGDGALDLDGDGLSNSNEFLAGGSPIRTDTDGDGMTDLDEWVSGTGISNALSFFAVATLQPAATNGGATVGWSAVTGRLYELFFATNLVTPSPWASLPPYTNVAGSGWISVTDTNTAVPRFYRLRTRLSP